MIPPPIIGASIRGRLRLGVSSTHLKRLTEISALHHLMTELYRSPDTDFFKNYLFPDPIRDIEGDHKSLDTSWCCSRRRARKFSFVLSREVVCPTHHDSISYFSGRRCWRSSLS